MAPNAKGAIVLVPRSTTSATIAANRFGLGARPGELATIAPDPQGWLLAQLTPERELPAELKALPGTADDIGAFYRWVGEYFAKAIRAGMDYAAVTNAATQPGMMSAAGGQAGGIEQDYIKTFVPRMGRAVKARFDVAARTDHPFRERLVHFWSNHFVVSGAKVDIIAMPPSFERDVIRPNITGKFGDMLMASSKHPAMLFYLDNWISVGPASAVGLDPSLRAPKGRYKDLMPKVAGLNENLAREILELQTVGVRAGYDQGDVTRFAKVITGWTVARPPLAPLITLVLEGRLNGKGLFQFDAEAHEPGAQMVMGRLYAQTGVDQGEAVLRDLARRPETARFISTKLARHFVSDDPPAAVVDRMTRAYLDSDGDLTAVYTALVRSPEAFQQPQAKFKQPEEYLISAARSVPGLNLDAGDLLKTFHDLGQSVYNPPGPNGWPDIQAEWLGADAVWKRFAWAAAAADKVAVANMDPSAVAAHALGATLSDDTRLAISSAESPAQGLTLLLASAEFQRR